MHHYSILPTPESNSKAVISLLQRLSWNSIAVISTSDLKYKSARENFIQLAVQHRINVSLKMQVSDSLVRKETTEQFLQELLNFGIKIVVAFVSPSESVDLICSAYVHNFIWPNYSWIIIDNDMTSLLNEILTTKVKVCSHSQAKLSVAINNTISLRYHLRNLDIETRLNNSAFYSAYLKQLEKSASRLNLSLQSNLYASVLYDAVWAFAIALNRSLCALKERNITIPDISRSQRSEIMDVLDDQMSQLTLKGVTGLLNFSQKTATVVSYVELIQVKNGHPELIGIYDSHTDQLILNLSAQERISNSLLDRTYVLYPIPLTVFLSVIIMSCFAMTVVSMCLFFYYRKQPAIKASSSTLSMSIFIGCYLLLISSLFHTINSGISRHEINQPLQVFICMFDIYLINTGLDTIIATLIAKRLRIYHIFNKFGKICRICSDRGRLSVIITAVFIKIVILILWPCLDIYHLVDKEQYAEQSVPPYMKVRQQCESNYHNVWIGLLFGYSTILIIILLVLAFMTRKIKRKHFNESKKITTLSGVLVCLFATSWSLWILLRLNDSSILSKVVYSLSTMFTAFFCQIFLILPKVGPLVYKKQHHKLVCKASQLTLNTSACQHNRLQFTTENSLLKTHPS